MDVVSLCPMRAWGFVWQSQEGWCAQTVVVKATFSLVPGQVTLAPEQEPPSTDDGYRNDDPNRNLLLPTDKAPYKPRADVMLVGHAYAPGKQPARSVVTRLIVGELDKSIEVFCDRGFRIHDSRLLEGQRFTKMRLGWDLAAGGPDTNNPIGMRFDASPDAYGIVPIPNLQPPGLFVSKRSDTFVPVCYEPIAPNWPTRAQRLGRLAGSFPQPGWTERPLPEGLDLAFFQAAPPDQQVSELRPNERLILENLHPDHARLVTSLPQLFPKAVVDRATGEREEVTLVADTLLIDTDRAVCIVVWRGRIGLRHAQEAGRIAVTMEEVAKTKTRHQTLPPSEDADEDEQDAGISTVVPPNERPQPPRAAGTMIPGLAPMEPSRGRIMPFVGSEQAGPRASASAPLTTNAALPFVRADSAQAPMPDSAPSSGPAWLKDRVSPVPAQPPAAVPAATPWSFNSPVPAAPVSPAPVLPGVVAPPGVVSPPGVVAPPAPVPPPPAARSSSPEISSPWASGSPPGVVSASASLGAAVGLGSAPLAGPSTSGRPGSATAASDAAAEPRVVAAPAPSPSPAPKLAPLTTSKPLRNPNDILDLLWYDETFVPRIRGYWEELVTELDFEPADPRRDLDAEDPEKARMRHNVFGILSDGDVVEPSGISRVVTDAVSQKGRFTPPLLLTAGELRFPFDEVETLKATIVAMTPFLGSDKRLKDMVDSMSELLKTPYLQGSTGIVDKLTRDLRAQFRESNRSLPATYLDGHVERLLLEQRRYAIRKVFGGEFIRALLQVPTSDGKASDSAIPVYLPKPLDQSLPMLVSMKVRLIAEAHLQQDPYDSSPYALRGVALGRSYQLDALRGSAKGPGLA